MEVKTLQEYYADNTKKKKYDYLAIIEEFKKKQKDSEITEDELRMAEEEIQKITDKKIAEIDTLLDNKEKEVMSV